MATHADADLVLKLYDLRREPEMRKARKFMVEQFWPESFEDLAKVLGGFGTQENAWFRQVVGYWSMAASFVESGILDPDLLLDSTGEMWFVYTKLKPFIPEARKNVHAEFLLKLEKATEKTQRGRDFIEYLKSAFEKRKQMMAQAQKAPAS